MEQHWSAGNLSVGDPSMPAALGHLTVNKIVKNLNDTTVIKSLFTRIIFRI